MLLSQVNEPNQASIARVIRGAKQTGAAAVK